MFIDVRELPQNTEIESEICIIGAGAAGITIARELRDKPYRICLLESGGLDFDADTQSLYQGKNVGLPYENLDTARLRYFGGTTNHWGGHCRPLQPIDFEKRSWVPHSGWPITKNELDPFYARAQFVCELARYDYDLESWLKEIDDPKLIPLPFKGERFTTVVTQYSAPTRFGEVYREDLRSSPNVTVYLHANVTEIETDDRAKRVVRLRIETLDGKGFTAKAKLYVLATGGIENARLLLLSNRVQDNGLGNQHDLVGRYFQEHPHLTSGKILFSRKGVSVDLYDQHYTYDKIPITGSLNLSPEVQMQEELLNYNCVITPVFVGEDSEGTKALKRFYHSAEDGDWPDNFWSDLGNIVSDIDDVAQALYGRVFRPSKSVDLFSIDNIVEQMPNPDSRVRLGQETDNLGRRRIELDWRMTTHEKKTLRRGQEILSEELGVSGIGRVKIELSDDDESWPPDLQWGWHHMGTTRMAGDAKQGVVNTDSKVFGISNLFIAGSSVFTTSGTAAPTLTIVALALRLADRLKGYFKS